MKALKLWLKAGSISIFIVLIVKVFVADVFTVATSSMEATIKPGDIILVDKFSHGSRVPSTLLAIPFLHQYIPFTNQIPCYLPFLELPYLRLPEFSSLKYNDIVLINYAYENSFPRDHKTLFLKRIVAIPGDTFEMKRGDVFVNGLLQKTQETGKRQYFVQFELPPNNDFFIENEIEINGKHNETKYTLNVSEDEMKNILPEMIENELQIDSLFDPHQMIFPKSKSIKNTKDQFTAFVIPEKNKTIRINSENIDYYRTILEKFENVELEIIENQVWIAGNRAEEYSFKMNYYFVIGDNRSHSADSRYWGLLPEDHIAGKAEMVLFSIRPKFTGKSGIRWSRTFEIL